jgi:hypothetical protein
MEKTYAKIDKLVRDYEKKSLISMEELLKKIKDLLEKYDREGKKKRY